VILRPVTLPPDIALVCADHPLCGEADQGEGPREQRWWRIVVRYHSAASDVERIEERWEFADWARQHGFRRAETRERDGKTFWGLLRAVEPDE
jgi:hypothetical protein